MAFSWNCFLFHDASFSENIILHIVTTTASSRKLLLTCYVLIILDFVATVGDFILLKVNQKSKTT